MAGRQIYNPEGFKNIEKDGSLTGFEFQFKAQYYRGITLSIVRDIKVNIDGEDAIRYITVICPIKNSADAPELSAKFKNKTFNENGLEVEVKVNGKKQSLNYKL